MYTHLSTLWFNVLLECIYVYVWYAIYKLLGSVISLGKLQFNQLSFKFTLLISSTLHLAIHHV